jgi:hypothetical protein
MADEANKPKLVHPESPKTETEPAKEFDSTAYFNRRLRPVILVEGALWPPEVPYIVPFHHPDPDREIPAYTSAWVAFEQARSGVWTQMRWEDGTFKISRAENNPHPATFSGKDLWELLAIGFKDRIINDPSHPYVRELRGDVSD